MKNLFKRPRITRIPGFLLSLKGWLHAIMNVSICKKKIQAWIDNEKEVYDNEIAAAEENLETIRLQLDDDISVIRHKMFELEHINNEDIKMRRLSQVAALKKRLVSNLNLMDSADRTLANRLRQIDHAVNSKLNDYMAGMAAAGKEGEYGNQSHEDIMTTHKGYQEYNKQHLTLKNEIASLTGDFDKDNKEVV